MARPNPPPPPPARAPLCLGTARGKLLRASEARYQALRTGTESSLEGFLGYDHAADFPGLDAVSSRAGLAGRDVPGAGGSGEGGGELGAPPGSPPGGLGEWSASTFRAACDTAGPREPGGPWPGAESAEAAARPAVQRGNSEAGGAGNGVLVLQLRSIPSKVARGGDLTEGDWSGGVGGGESVP